LASPDSQIRSSPPFVNLLSEPHLALLFPDAPLFTRGVDFFFYARYRFLRLSIAAYPLPDSTPLWPPNLRFTFDSHTSPQTTFPPVWAFFFYHGEPPISPSRYYGHTFSPLSDFDIPPMATVFFPSSGQRGVSGGPMARLG